MPRFIVEIPDYLEQEQDWMDALNAVLEQANIPATVDYAEE